MFKGVLFTFTQRRALLLKSQTRFLLICLSLCALALPTSAREDGTHPLPPSRDHHDNLSSLPDLGVKTDSDDLILETCRQPYRNDNSMLNTAHRYLSQSACAQALWFDDYFGDDAASDTYEYARTFIRVSHTQSYRWEEEIEPSNKFRVRARVYLPATERRFGLIISGESDTDA